MYLYNSGQIKAWDEFTIKEEKIQSSDLMERAGKKLFERFITLFPDKDFPVHIFCGTGNNGGDGMVMAKLLRNEFYNVHVYECKISKSESMDFTLMKNMALGYSNIKHFEVKKVGDIPLIQKGVVIDCLLGTGLKNEVSEQAQAIIEKINEFTQCQVVSIDVPSGMFIDEVIPSICVKAHHTFTIQNMKLSFLFESNSNCCGQIHLIDIGLNKYYKTEATYLYINKELVVQKIKTRHKFSHKGNFGKALLISGHESMFGASILALKAMLKSGVGLSCIAVSEKHTPVINHAAPESITLLKSTAIDYNSYNSIAIGPGLGTSDESENEIKKILQLNRPLILDADALNLISEHNLQKSIPRNSVLTPHPKEFDKLFGIHNSHYERILTQKHISTELGINIILKTAHSSLSTADGYVYFNSTGNAGMAKGGSGDALTGLLAGLIAKTDEIENSCIIAMFLHGLAGDIAARKHSIESFTISEMINCLDEAWCSMMENKC